MNDVGRRIDLIVTDLGGTLVKTDEAIMAAVRRTAKELGVPAPRRQTPSDLLPDEKGRVIVADQNDQRRRRQVWCLL